MQIRFTEFILQEGLFNIVKPESGTSLAGRLRHL